MSLDKQLFERVIKNAEGATTRFQTANTVLMNAAKDSTAKKSSGERTARPGGIRIYMPESDEQLIERLVEAAGLARVRSSRSEVVRAGIHLLQSLSDEEFIAAIKKEQT